MIDMQDKRLQFADIPSRFKFAFLEEFDQEEIKPARDFINGDGWRALMIVDRKAHV